MKSCSILYVVLMAATIVAVDIFFFRSRFWERLIVNIGNFHGFRGLLPEVPEASLKLIIEWELSS